MPRHAATVPLHMPGLSPDPEKRKRQLAGLRAGRLALARAEQARVEAGEPPADPAAAAPAAAAPHAAPTEPAPAHQAVKTGDASVGAGVHTWGAPPPPPEPENPNPAVPVAEDHADFTTERPQRGRLAGFLDGFAGD